MCLIFHLHAELNTQPLHIKRKMMNKLYSGHHLLSIMYIRLQVDKIPV